MRSLQSIFSTGVALPLQEVLDLARLGGPLVNNLLDGVFLLLLGAVDLRTVFFGHLGKLRLDEQEEMLAA